MPYSPGSNFAVTLISRSGLQQIPINSSGPTSGILRRNGVDDNSVSVTATVSLTVIGDYVLSGTIPGTYAIGDTVEIVFVYQTAGFDNRQAILLGPLVPPVIHGYPTAGAAGTITLAVGSSAVDDFYNGQIIAISNGTGAGQVRTVTGYVGTTRVATIDVAWTTIPDVTSQYWFPAFNPVVLRTIAVTQRNITVNES